MTTNPPAHGRHRSMSELRDAIEQARRDQEPLFPGGPRHPKHRVRYFTLLAEAYEAGQLAILDAQAPQPAPDAVAEAYDAQTENMIGWLLDHDCDRITVVEDFPCGLDKPMNDPDDGEAFEVATLETEDSGYAPALWRLALAVLRHRRALASQDKEAGE